MTCPECRRPPGGGHKMDCSQRPVDVLRQMRAARNQMNVALEIVEHLEEAQTLAHTLSIHTAVSEEVREAYSEVEAIVGRAKLAVVAAHGLSSGGVP